MVLTKNHNPKQGEVWLFNPDPIIGNEVGKKIRPAMIISCNALNNGFAGLAIVVPITSKNKKIFSHVPIKPPEGGLEILSYAMCEQIRSISKERLIKRLGKINDPSTIKEIHEWLTDLICLEK